MENKWIWCLLAAEDTTGEKLMSFAIHKWLKKYQFPTWTITRPLLDTDGFGLGKLFILVDCRVLDNLVGALRVAVGDIIAADCFILHKYKAAYNKWWFIVNVLDFGALGTFFTYWFYVYIEVYLFTLNDSRKYHS